LAPSPPPIRALNLAVKLTTGVPASRSLVDNKPSLFAHTTVVSFRQPLLLRPPEVSMNAFAVERRVGGQTGVKVRRKAAGGRGSAALV